jgi:carbamoyl-phosphate synthase large subunit
MKGSKDGRQKLVEINPRMGGGTIFAALAGANFPAIVLDMIRQKEIIKPTFSEVTIIRYFEEIVIDNNK